MKILWLVPLLLLAGCAQDPVYSSKTNNPKIEVSMLFENDGCKVYRFSNAGYWRYYVNCRNDSYTNTTRSSGKTHFDESVQTVYGD